MKEKVYLYRDVETEKQTLGTLLFRKENLFVKSWTTLELPYKNNLPSISCIPKGLYHVLYTYSQKFDRFTYEVLNVKNRKGIRIHAVNYYNQLKGCIGLGSNLYDLNYDGQLDITESRAAIKDFENELKRQPFILLIK